MIVVLACAMVALVTGIMANVYTVRANRNATLRLTQVIRALRATERIAEDRNAAYWKERELHDTTLSMLRAVLAVLEEHQDPPPAAFTEWAAHGVDHARANTNLTDGRHQT